MEPIGLIILAVMTVALFAVALLNSGASPTTAATSHGHDDHGHDRHHDHDQEATANTHDAAGSLADTPPPNSHGAGHH